jgi:threonylcarbamoyladenosine tRNA methylthiotransferase MtaB
MPWDPALVNTLQEVQLTKIDEDGSVRIQCVSEEV